MGGTGSKLGIINRDVLLKSTDPVRRLMDEGLRIMMDQISREDLRRLASPSECSKYVVMIGDAFDQYFRSIDVIPVLKASNKGKKTVFFQRGDILLGSASTGDRVLNERLRSERNLICKSIAYFYTRLFHILSALAYSVFDDARIRPGVGAAAGQQAYGILPAVAAQRPFVGGPALMRGGKAPELKQTSFKIFASEAQLYSRGEKMGNITYDIYTIGDITLRLNKSDPNQATLEYAGRSNMRLNIRVGGSDNTTLHITGVTILDPPNPSKVIPLNPTTYGGLFSSIKFVKVPIAVGAPKPDVDTYTTEKYLASNRTYTSLRQIIKQLFVHISTYLEDIKTSRPTPAFLSDEKRVFDVGYAPVAAAPYGYGAAPYGAIGGPYGRQAAAAPADIAALASRPVAHCVARSMQLLSMDIVGPMGGRKAWSFVCEPSFMAHGLPRAEHSITESPGIKGLAALYTVFREGVPKAMTKENAEYLAFLQTMEGLYMSSATTVDGIKNKFDGAVCKGRRGAEELSDARLAAAQAGVRDLWKRQIAHAGEVSALLGQMFIKDKKTGQLAIHPQLLTIGVIGLDIIAAKARSVLLKYYGDCESTYQAAVRAIYGGPAPGAPGAAAPGGQPQPQPQPR